MATSKKLSQAQRDFFNKVSLAAFCNPFSDDRYNLDLEISAANDSPSRLEATERAISEVYKQLQSKAGDRQVDNPGIGLTHNQGGEPGAAVVSVAIVGNEK